MLYCCLIYDTTTKKAVVYIFVIVIILIKIKKIIIALFLIYYYVIIIYIIILYYFSRIIIDAIYVIDLDVIHFYNFGIHPNSMCVIKEIKVYTLTRIIIIKYVKSKSRGEDNPHNSTIAG